jgi:MT0933-like antitoxin protein
MSFMDTLKDKLGMSKDKAGDLAHQHEDKTDQGPDKAGHAADSKTGGTYSGQTDSGMDRAQDAVRDHGNKGDSSDSS